MIVYCLTSLAVTRKACCPLRSSLSGTGEDSHAPHQPGPEIFRSVYLSQWASLMKKFLLLWKRWVLHLQEPPKKESVNVSSPEHQYWYLMQGSAEHHLSARSLPHPHVTPPLQRWQSLSQRLPSAEDLSPAWSASLENKHRQVGDLTLIAVKYSEDFQNRFFPCFSCRYLPISWYLLIKQPPLQEIKLVCGYTACMAAILKMGVFSWD